MSDPLVGQRLDGHQRLPMFPLGSVLFPYVGLPLHIFEPRYRVMIQHVLEADVPQFGVTLIERGSEVGGGDHRSAIGTVAQVVEAGQLEDGRWVLQCVGIERLRVLEWLPDAPYPHAVVEGLAEPFGSLAGPELIGSIDAAVSKLRRVLALATEANLSAAPATIELDDDPSVRLWQIAAVAPFGPFDDHRLLCCPTQTDRVQLIHELLDDAKDTLQAQLAR
jgi:uncharacterized protein